MGYLTKKYSTLLRGPWFTYMKERRLAGKMTRHMRRIHQSIFTKIPEDVKKHKVTKVLNEIKRLVEGGKLFFIFPKEGLLDKTGKEEYKFIFDEMYSEEAVLKRIIQIEKMIEELRAKARAEHKKDIEELEKKVDNIIAVHLLNAGGKLKKYDKAEYKDDMNIIKAAKTIDKETFMNQLKVLFKDIDVSKLRRFPIRKNVRVFRRDTSKLKIDEKNIKTVIKEIETMLKGKKVKDSPKEIIKKIEQFAKQIENDLIEGFYEAYKGMKRVFNLIYLLIGYEDVLSLQLEGWEKQKLLPSSPVQKNIKELQDVKARRVNEMHIIAQALRRIYQEERKVEREAVRLAA